MENKEQKPLKKIITTKQEIYYSKCPICSKEIAGRGIKGYRYNLLRHMQDKHKEEKRK